MVREFGQRHFKFEASVNVVNVVMGVEELSVDYAELHSHVLESRCV